MISTTSVLLAATVGPVLFGVPGEWFIVSRAGEVVATYGKFGGLDAVEAAVSPDGKVVAFTTWDDKVQNPLLYKWDVGGATASLLGEPQGFHASPDFTNDGKWVYFAHHPRKGGPPGKHEVGANAQLYRVRTNGTGLEALTSEPGCHMHPNVGSKGAVVYAHTGCRMGRSVKIFANRRSTKGLEPAFGEFDAPVFDRSEQRIAFAMQTRVDVAVYERRTADSATPTELLRIANPSEQTRLAYGNSDDIIYQDATGIWISTRTGERRLIAEFASRK